MTGGGTPSDTSGTLTVKDLPSEIYRQSDLKHMTRITKDREQEQEKYLGERPADCTAGVLTDALDPLGNLADIVGDTLTDELALAVCRQHRSASGGQVCDGWDGEETCPACQGMRGVGIKTLNYIKRKSNLVKNPQGYVVGCIKRAVPDTANLMDRTKEGSEYQLDWMRSLAPQTVTISESPAPTTVDIGELAGNASTKVDAAKADHAAPDPAQAEREAAAQRAASRQRREREKTMTPAEIAADFESRRRV